MKSNIVEGYGRRIYKQEFLKFLTYAIASNDETCDHIETLWNTKSLTNKELFTALLEQNIKLGKKLNNFIKSVNEKHNKLIPDESN